MEQKRGHKKRHKEKGEFHSFQQTLTEYGFPHIILIKVMQHRKHLSEKKRVVGDLIGRAANTFGLT